MSTTSAIDAYRETLAALVSRHSTALMTSLARLEGQVDQLAEAERDGIVAMRLLRPALDHGAGTGGDHRDRNVPAVVGEHAGHPNLAAKDVFHRLAGVSTDPGVLLTFPAGVRKAAAGVGNLGIVTKEPRLCKTGLR